jgi:hypothetical protein
MTIDLAIVGAGPYGLSIAAHLANSKLVFRIFGSPMESWRQKMPRGMLLKSEGFASSLFDPGSTFTLRHYCEEKKLPYADIGLPIPLETFIAYGLEFQKRFVPSLDETNVERVRRTGNGFILHTEDGQLVQARRVVIAAGITHFAYLPPPLAGLSPEYVTHSSHHRDLRGFAGRRVAVIGAGASALDIAVLLHEAGAHVELVARRSEIAFHSPPNEPRPWLHRLRSPRSGLGIGWRSCIYAHAPHLFHLMPQKVRFRVVQNHLGPAPGWFVHDKAVGRFPIHLGCRIEVIAHEGGKIRLRLVDRNNAGPEQVFDHVIGGTGYRVAVSRLAFLDESMRKEIQTVDDTPVLNRNFESSVPGLYLVGVASANSFGPLTRFAFGAGFTARRLSRHLCAEVCAADVPECSQESAVMADRKLS